MESYGGGAPAASDAAIAGLAWRAALAGERDDLTLEMGDIGLFRTFLAALGLPPPLVTRLDRAFRRPQSLRAELERAQTPAPAADGNGRIASMLADLPPDAAAEALQELWSLAGVQPVGGRSPAEIAHRLAERAEAARAPALSAADADKIARFLAISDQPVAALGAVGKLAKSAALETAVEAWSARVAALMAEGASKQRMRLSTAFGRAFGYYDGFLFEARSMALGPDRPVAAGGRYDGLLARLGARRSAGAVGCMVRPWRAYAGGER